MHIKPLVLFLFLFVFGFSCSFHNCFGGFSLLKDFIKFFTLFIYSIFVCFFSHVCFLKYFFLF
jgi:hypothetical protein